MPGCPAHLVNSRPTVLAVGVGGDCLDSFRAGGDRLGYFSITYYTAYLSHSLWGMARYRLKCCLKWPLLTQNNLPFSFEEIVSVSISKGVPLLAFLVKILCDWQVSVKASLPVLICIRLGTYCVLRSLQVLKEG